MRTSIFIVCLASVVSVASVAQASTYRECNVEGTVVELLDPTDSELVLFSLEVTQSATAAGSHDSACDTIAVGSVVTVSSTDAAFPGSAVSVGAGLSLNFIQVDDEEAGSSAWWESPDQATDPGTTSSRSPGCYGEAQFISTQSGNRGAPTEYTVQTSAFEADGIPDALCASFSNREMTITSREMSFTHSPEDGEFVNSPTDGQTVTLGYVLTTEPDVAEIFGVWEVVAR